MIGAPVVQKSALPEFVLPSGALPFIYASAKPSQEWPRRLFAPPDNVSNPAEQAAMTAPNKDLEPLLVGIVTDEKVRTAVIRYDNKILRLQERAIFGPWTVEKIDTRTTRIRSGSKIEELRVDR